VPTSHASPPTVFKIPSPQFVTQGVLTVGHFHPVSTVQVDEHPSPATKLPSSHPSVPSKTPFPHYWQVPAFHLQPELQSPLAQEVVRPLSVQ